MSILTVALAAFLLAPAPQQSPREESPVPRDVLANVGAGNTDEELQQSIAAASAHPLGTAANPIRVAGPEGAHAYLARLRCGNGSSPTIGIPKEGGVGTYGTILKLYQLDCGAAAPGKVDLLVDYYHEENAETRAPAGFRAGS